MAKNWAMIIGWVLLILGVLGFITNPLVGGTGYFHADAMHNIIHIILGGVLLWAAHKAPAKAHTAVKWVGIILLVLAILGFVLVSGTGTLLGLAEINGADNWLHLVLGALLLWAGMKKSHMQM
jgi:predicted small integral membrane protein